MRRNEQYTLVWSDVDFEQKVMRLRKTKNGKPRDAYIIRDEARALKQIKMLSLERRDRSRTQPNRAPKNTVFAKAENKKWWNAVLNRAKIKNYLA